MEDRGELERGITGDELDIHRGRADALSQEAWESNPRCGDTGEKNLDNSPIVAYFLDWGIGSGAYRAVIRAQGVRFQVVAESVAVRLWYGCQ